MILCHNCGKENKNTAKFCTGCGTNMLISKQSVQQNENFPFIETKEVELLCAKCGNQNKANAKFCVKCGNSFAALMQQVQQNPSIEIQEVGNNEFLCGKCGKQNKESAKFCITCGSSLKAIEKHLEENNIYHLNELIIKKNIEINQEETPLELNISDISDNELNQADTQEVPERNGDNMDVIEDIIQPIRFDQVGNLNKCKEYPIDQILPIKDGTEVFQYVPVKKNEPAGGHEEDTVKAEIPTFEEAYPDYPNRKRKKIIIWTISVLAIAGLGFFLLFSNPSNKSKIINQRDSSDNVLIKPMNETDSVISVPNNETGKLNEQTISDTTIGTPDEQKLPKQDNFKYLSLNQIRNDLLNKELCDGLVFTGEQQQLTISGYFPDMLIQKTLQENITVIVTVNLKDLFEDKSCAVEVYYKKKENKFSFENYAAK